MTESELIEISSDGPRAYAPFTEEDLRREQVIDAYHDWLDAQADNAGTLNQIEG